MTDLPLSAWSHGHVLRVGPSPVSEERWLAPMINPSLFLLHYLIFNLKDLRPYLQTFPEVYTYNSSPLPMLCRGTM